MSAPAGPRRPGTLRPQNKTQVLPKVSPSRIEPSKSEHTRLPFLWCRCFTSHIRWCLKRYGGRQKTKRGSESNSIRSDASWTLQAGGPAEKKAMTPPKKRLGGGLLRKSERDESCTPYVRSKEGQGSDPMTHRQGYLSTYRNSIPTPYLGR